MRAIFSSNVAGSLLDQQIEKEKACPLIKAGADRLHCFSFPAIKKLERQNCLVFAEINQ